jgi:hypothetical protein
MSNGTESTWRPSSDVVTLPADPAVVWARLTELISLPWPTAAEQTERIALVVWLNPAEGSTLRDGRLFEIATEVINTSPQSSPEFLEPAYVAAGAAWFNLCLLHAGQPVPPSRPPLEPDEGDHVSTAAFDAWQATRKAQAQDWFATVMRWLDSLLRAEVLYSFDLPEMVTSHDLVRQLRRKVMEVAFDGPYAIGASLFLEPGLPGTGLGYDGQSVDAADALTVALEDAIRRFGELEDGDEAAETTARIQLMFWLMLLKGFIYAGAAEHLGTPLPDQYVGRGGWERTRRALIDGRDALVGRYGETVPNHWMSLGHRLSEKIANARTEDLVAAMDERIAQATRMIEQLRHMR